MLLFNTNIVLLICAATAVDSLITHNCASERTCHFGSESNYEQYRALAIDVYKRNIGIIPYFYCDSNDICEVTTVRRLLSYKYNPVCLDNVAKNSMDFIHSVCDKYLNGTCCNGMCINYSPLDNTKKCVPTEDGSEILLAIILGAVSIVLNILAYNIEVVYVSSLYNSHAYSLLSVNPKVVRAKKNRRNKSLKI